MVEGQKAHLMKLLFIGILWINISVLAWALETTNSAGYLRTRGSDIVDHNGNVVRLRGVNIGGWLVTESWMCGQRDDGKRGALEELESRFGADKAARLMSAWQDNWFTVRDLDKIQSFGFNLIRVPFSSRNFQQAKSDLIKNGAGDIDFSRLDWVVTEAAKRGIYVVLDFHVWPRQLEKDNYGLPSRASHDGLVVRQQMAATWGQIAAHFKGNADIAGFDVINEPEGSPGDLPHHAFYDAIRAADPDRIVIVEWVSYPGLAKSGWTNIVWSPHYPESTLKTGTIEQRLAAFDAKEKISATPEVQVPIFVGEAKAPDDDAESARNLAKGFDVRGWSWAIWTYKAVNCGGWAAFNYNNLSYDLSKDSYDEIMTKWTIDLTEWQSPSNGSTNFSWTDWWIKGFSQAEASPK